MVLERFGNTETLRTKEAEPASSFIRDSLILKNMPVKNLVYWLNQFCGLNVTNPLFVDSTGINHNIDIQLPLSIMEACDVNAINALLKKKGLSLTKKEVMMDMLVIKDE